MGHGTARAYIPTAEKVSKVWGMARHGLEVGDGADSSQYATCMSRSSTSAVTVLVRFLSKLVHWVLLSPIPSHTFEGPE
ncbi:unnamed protein product [Sphagnum jensenii]|uniref:Uncharacterized protein n=1 Tax=Sphagnum jensenii TaxID=128206 RepID=A0ABP0VQE1_9BRYO